eukprot:gene7325-8529_t
MHKSTFFVLSADKSSPDSLLGGPYSDHIKFLAEEGSHTINRADSVESMKTALDAYNSDHPIVYILLHVTMADVAPYIALVREIRLERKMISFITVYLDSTAPSSYVNTAYAVDVSRIFEAGASMVTDSSSDVISSMVAKMGWWLPGGRVNTGENLQATAVRETKEESGIDVDIKGILRMEYSPNSKYSRMRLIFYAEPLNEDQLPKSIPDYESVGAAYVSLQELDRMQLRGKEPKMWMRYLDNGGQIYPISLLTLENAPLSKSGTTSPLNQSIQM